MNKYINSKNIIFVVIFIAGLAIGVNSFNLFRSQSGLSSEEAGEVAINFINKAIEPDNVTASLSTVIEESGVYKVHLQIEENEYDSFITKDGKYLFSSAFNLEEEQEQLPQ